MAFEAKRERSGTFGAVWLDGEQVAEAYGCKIYLSKTKDEVPMCDTMMAGHKVTGLKGTGTVRLYNATSRLMAAEGAALQKGIDLRHIIISKLADPDAGSDQRFAVTGVSFDDLTLADWEAAKLGSIDAPFTFDGYEILDL